ncbi:MAG: serine protein kinase PrkA [Polyangiales bacterium]
MAQSSRAELDHLAASVKDRFLSQKRVLSFEEYLAELLAHPWRHSRDAARYLRDCFDHYGHYDVARPFGPVRRFRLFDQDFGQGAEGRKRLVGQEELQNGFYRALGNFVREGRANRLVLLHGPNGSAKSTFAECLMRALEHYSTEDAGALYRFSWVFSRAAEERSIGFGSGGRGAAPESYAHLDHEKITAKLGSELREHPLLLLPIDERRALLRQAYAAAKIEEAPPQWLWNGELGRKSAAVFEALLASYGGDLRRVLGHVQVERFYVSRRYRTGAVTIGPQMSVDAAERQITADRSLADLPASLSSVSLYETMGELVDGQCGIVEYSDLLKRPLEAWKYLLLAIEEGEVALPMSMLTVNSVLLASTNEVHLEAFRQHPEYNSFRARLLTLRAGYLLDYRREQEIYDRLIVSQIRQHVSPHATLVAALWAVLTRLLPSDADHYEDPALGKIAADLSPMEKARLYADGTIPGRLGGEQGKLLRAGIAEVAREFDTLAVYEGLTGASAREIRTVLLDASQHPLHACLSPLGVFDNIDALCDRGDYEFLQHKPEGGYHDARGFLTQVRSAWLDLIDEEVRRATGLVEESRYLQLFDRYIQHVSLWLKGERYRDPVTGEQVEPDQGLLKRIEVIFEVKNVDEFRRNLISMIAAQAIDHPDDPIDHAQIFPRHLEQVKAAYFLEHRGQIADIVSDVLKLVSEGESALQPEARSRAQQMLAGFEAAGYCKRCAPAALGELRKERYA